MATKLRALRSSAQIGVSQGNLCWMQRINTVSCEIGVSAQGYFLTALLLVASG